MAIRCDDCRYAFTRKRSTCPFCGMRLSSDDADAEALLRSGYRMAPGEGGAQPQAAQDAPGEQELDELRRAYFAQHRAPDVPQPEPQPEPEPVRRRSAPPARAAGPAPQSSAPGPTGADYLAQAAGARAGALPVVEVPQTAPGRTPAPAQDDPYEAELQRLERQRRRLDRQYRRNAFENALANIRWGAVLRVLAVVFVVALLVSAWQMRYAIANALVSVILELVVAFLPAILILAAIWYLLRRIFR